MLIQNKEKLSQVKFYSSQIASTFSRNKPILATCMEYKISQLRVSSSTTTPKPKKHHHAQLTITNS